MLAGFSGKGLGVDFGGWLFIHGTTELFAAVLAGAAGLRIGTAVVFPGASGRLEAAAAAGRIAGKVMVGVIVMLLAAGLLEGFGRQLITDTLARYGIGPLMLFFWLGYYYLPHQIGRTSCRERGVQVVSISGVSVSLKIKKHTQS